MKKIAVVFGGAGSEHSISKVSCDYLLKQLKGFKVETYELEKGMVFKKDNQAFELNSKGVFFNTQSSFAPDYLIPCMHGNPGESGEFQAYLQLIELPYLSANSESSVLCFNKSITKLLLEHHGIATTPFINLTELDLDKANDFFDKHQRIFIKASNQGSSIGCFEVSQKSQIHPKLKEAFEKSTFVTIEKALTPRELEVAAFEYKGDLNITLPGEVIVDGKFYDYESKYGANSAVRINCVAKLEQAISIKMQNIARLAFKALNLKDLARIDFFLDEDGTIYLNEINTFPGMTPISLFPLMMENHGVSFTSFLQDRVNSSL